jgi:prolyl oligopeptidase
MSNGGLLVAGTLAQRPDLFAVAIAEVPQTDGLRFERGRHTAQFGTPSNPTQFPFLYAYSPLHQIKPHRCYPATLLTTALNDERVPAWHAFKFAAALQAAQDCVRPIALRVDIGGGHSGLAESFTEDQVDMLTFVARGTGIRMPPARR